ncbi:MAG: hypothetical protein KGQ45_08500, partial [Burkholderiales bacterium]|nr:hypothetical protein [Burkholderiales bacterium]
GSANYRLLGKILLAFIKTYAMWCGAKSLLPPAVAVLSREVRGSLTQIISDIIISVQINLSEFSVRPIHDNAIKQ